MKKGLFITFEGPDGSGKTTQIHLLKNYLNERGYEAVITREPGGTRISEKIRTLILDRDNREMDHLTEALLYAASRAQHVSELIIPNLEKGITVICDRFMDSSIAYQGYGRKLGEQVQVINEYAVKGILPNLTFFLKVAPHIGKSRIEVEVQDRLEMEKIQYHNDVFEGYLELERKYPNRIVPMDGTQSIEKIHQSIVEHIDKLLFKGQS